MKTLFKLLFLVLLLTSCNKSKSSSNLGMVNMVSDSKEGISQKPNLSSDDARIERKLIKSGRIEFETKDLKKTHQFIIDEVKKYQGYIVRDRSYKSSYRISNTLKIRIPTKNFDVFLSDISKNVEKFNVKEISAVDVTEEFLDTEARLKTKKALEKRFLQILQKAKNVSEILEVERQIGNLRTEIESIEGRLKYLKNQVSFSSIDITFYKEIKKESNFLAKFKEGFKNGFDNLILFFVFLVNIWPFMIICIILIIVFNRWRKKRKK